MPAKHLKAVTLQSNNNIYVLFLARESGGSVYLFSSSNGGGWSQDAQLVGCTRCEETFGSSLAMTEDLVAVGNSAGSGEHRT